MVLASEESQLAAQWSQRTVGTLHWTRRCLEAEFIWLLLSGLVLFGSEFTIWWWLSFPMYSVHFWLLWQHMGNVRVYASSVVLHLNPEVVGRPPSSILGSRMAYPSRLGHHSSLEKGEAEGFQGA